MKCPHCQQEILGPECPNCEAVVPEGAGYCMNCGTAMEMIPESVPSEENDELDLDSRILCPDGACTGIIENGKCIECGIAYKE